MYSEPSETSNMEFIAEIVDCIPLLTIFAEHFILGVSQGYEYVSNKTKPNSDALSFTSQKIRTSIHVPFISNWFTHAIEYIWY